VTTWDRVKKLDKARRKPQAQAQAVEAQEEALRRGKQSKFTVDSRQSKQTRRAIDAPAGLVSTDD
jgi:hypothetical protein